MEDLHIFEFLVYLVPGIFSTIGFACLLLRFGRFDPQFWDKNQAFFGLCFVAFAFAAGLAIHILANGIFLLMQEYLLYSPIPEVSNYLKHEGVLPEIRSRIEAAVGVTPRDDLDLFRYAQYILVLDGNQIQARVERLQGLALLCRNLLIAFIIFFTGAYCYISGWRTGIWKNLGIIILVSSVANLLVKGSLNYSVAATLAVYRGILVSVGPLD